MYDGWMVHHILVRFCFRSLDNRHILTVATGMYVLHVCTYCMCVYVLSVCTYWKYVLYVCVCTIYIIRTMIISHCNVNVTAGPLSAATVSYRVARGWTTDRMLLAAVRNADAAAVGVVVKCATATAAQPSQDVLTIHIEQMTLSELIQSSR